MELSSLFSLSIISNSEKLLLKLLGDDQTAWAAEERGENFETKLKVSSIFRIKLKSFPLSSRPTAPVKRFFLVKLSPAYWRDGEGCKAEGLRVSVSHTYNYVGKYHVWCCCRGVPGKTRVQSNNMLMIHSHFEENSNNSIVLKINL